MSEKRVSRRSFITSGTTMTAALAIEARAQGQGLENGLATTPILELKSSNHLEVQPDDEQSWHQIAEQYDVSDKITNLENGYWGIMSRPVLQKYKELTDYINRENTLFARFDTDETYQKLRNTVADFLKVDTAEIALTRGATESLQSLIGGYNKLQPGDTVLYADLDYSEMKNAMRWLEQRRGVSVAKVNFPEPSRDQPLTESDILAFYQSAFKAYPKTKLLLLTHLNNWTGLIIPVAKITSMAREHGIDVILDAAHSIGQVEFDIKNTGCDFVGVNLHKWVGAPIGCGVIYIDKSRVSDIDSFMAKSPGSGKVTDRIDTGTSNFAAHMTIPSAIDFHNLIGTPAKEARLRYLRGIWVEEARKIPQLLVLTPDDSSMVAGLTSFRKQGVLTTKANNALMKRLAEQYGILTCRRTGPAAGDCIRVTPSFYNKPDDLMKLVRALREIV